MFGPGRKYSLKNVLPLLTLIAALAATTGAVAGQRALLIGIEKYPNVPSLKGPKKDVKKMQRLVMEVWGYRDDQIKTLIDEDAKREGILDAIEQWLIGGSEPGDHVLFYYSGHGYQERDQDNDEEDRYDETLIAFDAIADGRGAFDNVIRDDEIGKLFDKMEDRFVTMIIDSCHSGTVSRSIVPDQQYSPLIKSPRISVIPEQDQNLSKDLVSKHREEGSFIHSTKTRVVWSAVDASQKALIESGVAGSVFTNRFDKGLRQRKADVNGDKKVSNVELLDYLRKESDKYCQKYHWYCQLGLTPTLEIHSSLLAKDVAVVPRFRVEQSAPNETTDSVQQLQSTTANVEPDSLQTAGQGSGAVDSTSNTEQQQGEGVGEVQALHLVSVLLNHANEAGLDVELLPSESVRLGNRIKFKVTSNRAGSLILFNIDSEDRLTQLYPNQYSEKVGKHGQISARVPITIPDDYYGFELTASEPVGSGKVVAILIEDESQMEDLLLAHKDLSVVAKPDNYLSEIALRLRDVWTGDNTNRSRRWSVAQLDYSIEP